MESSRKPINTPMPKYVIYLRKSRQDLEAEFHGEADVLVTHRKTLIELAERNGYQIGAIYEEIVSGDTISDRPQMQKLLREVERGMWHGVLVMEIERLARGDSIDQGIVTRAFKYSGTYIITPSKIFDPNNYYDEEHLEFDLFMSRREYKMINRRLQAGRIAAAKDGRWLGGPTPYGYDSQRLDHGKGYTLVPNKDAETIRAIFDFYTSDPKLGTTKLCNKLNSLGYRSSTGKVFNVGIVKEILRNPIYVGYVTWGRRGVCKRIVNGNVVPYYPRSKDYQIYKGKHEALISEEIWNAAQEKLDARSFHPVPKKKELQNPLSGLLICGKCGHKMQARPQASGRYIFCHLYCGMVSSRMEEVEVALMKALKLWLKEYSAAPQVPWAAGEDAHSLQNALDNFNKEIAAIDEQRDRAFELVETGVYTPALFKERERVLSARRERIISEASIIRKKMDEFIIEEQTKQKLIPQVARVIETYDLTESAQEKNDMLRSIVSKIVYNKTTSVQSESGSDLKLTIYPVIPFKQH